jgi:hypothetical protein
MDVMIIFDALIRIQEIVKPININIFQEREAIEHGVFDYLYKKNLQVFKEILENKIFLKIIFRDTGELDDRINKFVSEMIKEVTGMVETELSVFKSMGLISNIDTKIASGATVGTMQMVMQAMFDDDTIIQDIESLAVKVTELQMCGLFKAEGRRTTH